MILCQLLLNNTSSASLLLQNTYQQLTRENLSLFSFVLDALLQSFDASGGGAIGYLRRSLFVQSMLCCILQGGSQDLERLEEVMDCVVSVISEEEVGEEKLRLLFTEKSLGGNELMSTNYLNAFTTQSSIRNYLGNSLNVRYCCKNDISSYLGSFYQVWRASILFPPEWNAFWHYFDLECSLLIISVLSCLFYQSNSNISRMIPVHSNQFWRSVILISLMESCYNQRIILFRSLNGIQSSK